MIDFFSNYGSAILRILNLILWTFWYRKAVLKNFNNLTVKYFLGFNLIHILWNVSMIIGQCHPKIYIGFWMLIVIFEIVFILTILFKINNLMQKFRDYYIICIAILSIPVILAGIIASINWDYKPINTTDFNFQIILMLGSIIIIKSLLSQKDFLLNIESFFIFSGLALLFGLHILASNAQLFGFLKNWKIANYSTILTQFFWLGGALASWKIKLKYLS